VLATPRPDYQRPHAAIVCGLKAAGGAQESGMDDPGVDRHEWESEWQALEEDLRADPAGALPELDRLVARMLDETGYDLTDPVATEGEEREVVAEYLAAHEIAEAVEKGSDELSPGDVAAAVDGLRAVFDHIVTTRSSADADLETADVETEEA
jgi:hypothetical protein